VMMLTVLEISSCFCSVRVAATETVSNENVLFDWLSANADVAIIVEIKAVSGFRRHSFFIIKFSLSK